jgi:hypothetical protein
MVIVLVYALVTTAALAGIPLLFLWEHAHEMKKMRRDDEP